ncbi:PP2C family protein-serine/threonine phosphatase [Ktedonosporobacter rubrisoli]|nr:protein phosphatase 2C domain-containing protein [Ktedonosporobacter rubrisoli]
MAIKVLWDWLRNLYEQRRFAAELQEAEFLAEQMAMSEVEKRMGLENVRELEMEWQPQTALVPAVATPRRASVPPQRPSSLRQEEEIYSDNAIPAYMFSSGKQRVMPRARLAPMEKKSSPVAVAPSPVGPATQRQERALPQRRQWPREVKPPTSRGRSDLELREVKPPTSRARSDQAVQVTRQHEEVSRAQPAYRASSAQVSPVQKPIQTSAFTDDLVNSEDDDATLPYLKLINQGDTLPTTENLAPEKELEEALRLVVGIGLDPGIVRVNAPNEDNLFAIQGMRAKQDGPEPVGLFVVADGMGGHAHGQEASRMAVQTISDVVAPVILRSSEDENVFAELLKEGAHRANLAIYQRNRQQEHMMGTTMTAALVVGSIAYIINVGDSRTYLYRAHEGLRQVTRDHSIVARLVEDGVIAPDDIYTHPKRNQIYRCLGERASVEMDTFVEALQPGDVLVLCSDGLWEMVRDSDIHKIIAASAPHPSQISTMLIQAALARGGADNVSVVVICVLGAEK